MESVSVIVGASGNLGSALVAHDLSLGLKVIGIDLSRIKPLSLGSTDSCNYIHIQGDVSNDKFWTDDFTPFLSANKFYIRTLLFAAIDLK